MKLQDPIRKRIVLVGGGHSHVTVLRAFGMRPEAGVGITVIAREFDAPYSGMLPGFVAGHYSLDDCQIDLVRLCQFAGARLIHGEAVGLDRAARRVLLKDRPPIAYDLLSFDTGITPSLADIDGAAEHAIAVKPVSTFAPRWEALLRRALAADGPRSFAVVGTGAAGFELVLAIQERLRTLAPRHGIDWGAFRFVLIGSGHLLTAHSAAAQRFARSALTEAGIRLVEGDAAVRVTPGAVHLASGRSVLADATLVTTKAAPPAWFASTDLERDAAGFLAVRPSLQVLGDDDVFAVGDCAAVLEHPREKAGVFAVRQGPPLTENLRRRARGEAAHPFIPQRAFLTLLSLGGRSAIANRGPFAAKGAWMWRWKDRIDRAFMRKFKELPMMGGGAGGEAGEPMACGGCAAKVGPVTLQGALARLGPAPAAAALRDLAPGEDAALLDLGGGDLRLETADFFRSFWPEPYVFGEISAVHALSDIAAKGGVADHALAIVQVPHASAALQQDDLYQVMAGARAVFDREGIGIVGGHSAQGPELAAGFFVSGRVARDGMLRKDGGRAGDRLVLTKPLGTGILFAAWMRGLARAGDIAAVLAGMRRSNMAAARIAIAHGATAATDVTGFGLAGHLLEMLEGGALAARVDLSALPLYAGAMELARAGVQSTLLADNLARSGALGGDIPPGSPMPGLLFDPQTSGGLLVALPDAASAACLAEMRARQIDAAIIGTFEAGWTPGNPRILLAAASEQPKAVAGT